MRVTPKNEEKKGAGKEQGEKRRLRKEWSDSTRASEYERETFFASFSSLFLSSSTCSPLYFWLLPCAKREALPALYWVTLWTVCLRHTLPAQKVLRVFGMFTIWKRAAEQQRRRVSTGKQRRCLRKAEKQSREQRRIRIRLPHATQDETARKRHLGEASDP